MLGDGSDVFWCRACGGWVLAADGGGRVEQASAQVLQEAETVAGHGQAAPAGRCPVEHGPHQGEAAGLAGQSADDLDPAAGLAEGPFD